jgi:hypothetical protein
MKSFHRSNTDSKISRPKLLLKVLEQIATRVSKPAHSSLVESKAMSIMPQLLCLPDPNVYEPFDDPENPTFDPNHEVVDGILRLRNFAPSAYEDIMFIPLRKVHGDCTGLLDIGYWAFNISLSQLLGHYANFRERFFANGIRIYLNGGIAGRQSVRRFHWRAIGSGPNGGDLGPYRTRRVDNQEVEVAPWNLIPADFHVQPAQDCWQVMQHPTPQANVDLLLVPPEPLWHGGLQALRESPAYIDGLSFTLRGLLVDNPLHFAWGYRFLILSGKDARQSPIPGLPFECRLLAGGIAPGNPLPVPCYDDLGRYSMVPGLPDEERRTELVRLLNERAKQLGKRIVASHWGEELERMRAVLPPALPVG